MDIKPLLEELKARAGETVTLTVKGTNGELRDVDVTLRPPEGGEVKVGDAFGLRRSSTTSKRALCV